MSYLPSTASRPSSPVTRDPFIVFTSNIFAIMGLRALYFLLADMVDRFHYLKYGLAIVLIVIGGKMLAARWIHVPVHWSLGVVGLGVGRIHRRQPAVAPAEGCRPTANP